MLTHMCTRRLQYHFDSHQLGKGMVVKEASKKFIATKALKEDFTLKPKNLVKMLSRGKKRYSLM